MRKPPCGPPGKWDWPPVSFRIVEALGGLVADWIRRVTPRAALLSTLSGIALGFISMEFTLRSFDKPPGGPGPSGPGSGDLSGPGVLPPAFRVG